MGRSRLQREFLTLVPFIHVPGSAGFGFLQLQRFQQPRVTVVVPRYGRPLFEVGVSRSVDHIGLEQTVARWKHQPTVLVLRCKLSFGISAFLLSKPKVNLRSTRRAFNQ